MKLSIMSEAYCLCTFIVFACVVVGQDIPKIQPFSFLRRIPIGDKASVTCTVSSTSTVTFSWLHNGISVSDVKNIRIRDGTDYTLLIIDPVDIVNEGNYTCIATSKEGGSSYTTHLQVEAPPVWVEEPKDASVILGNPLKIKCEASGSPIPQIVWKKMEGKIF
ncbi:palladin-like [Centruroides vittatus]|uniref:palladin-like n=1 Tax=Centruroides vittatus TaxID=120091 RepID=UPI00350F983B